jgi:hypothetical protein
MLRGKLHSFTPAESRAARLVFRAVIMYRAILFTSP